MNIYNDEHDGQGGSYVRDPLTGVRTLVERTGLTPVADPAPVAELTSGIPLDTESGADHA